MPGLDNFVQVSIGTGDIVREGLYTSSLSMANLCFVLQKIELPVQYALIYNVLIHPIDTNVVDLSTDQFLSF